MREYLKREFGISEEQLEIKEFIKSREELKSLFRQMELAIMPSRTEGFGLSGLEALSAGLPILVSNNSGLAHALRKINFGESCIVDSDDAEEWAKKIKDVRGKDRTRRLHENNCGLPIKSSTAGKSNALVFSKGFGIWWKVRNV